MTYTFDGYNYILKFTLGENLMENLAAFAREKQLNGAWMNGLGGASQATLGYYHLDTQEYEWRDFPELMEVTSLQGNLAWAGDEPVWHVHATVTDNNFAAYGGHVKELVVGAALEVFVHVRFGEEKLTRTLDEKVGLKTLNI